MIYAVNAKEVIRSFIRCDIGVLKTDNPRNRHHTVLYPCKFLLLIEYWKKRPGIMKSFLAYVVFLALINASYSVEPTHKYTAYVFLGTECPISQKYIPTLNSINETSTQLSVIGVFSEHLTHDALEVFREQFKVNFALKHDTKFVMADRFGAVVTPEVFLVDEKGTVLYSGAIDNWFVSLGRNRFAPSEHYLIDAFKEVISGKKVEVSNKPAIGCFLERHKSPSHEHQ